MVRLATRRLPSQTPGGPDQRLVINGIFFLLRSGAALRTAPPWSTAESYYGQWQADGTWDRITAALQAARSPHAALPAPHLRQAGERK